MATRSTLQQAQASAARALATHHAADDSLSLSEAIAALHDHANAAQASLNGRELALFESHPERMAAWWIS
jgi:hypothetical protein